ncbi:GlxA family transcriptional regulator [Kineobactrum salinum]|uniref:Helix-turn-helix domain-containing protein n=1 Tax=Kineobactrum salinum TaxID=2708301 RepID=A0A6C0TYL3_9GAMM|nr:helix-turn-helix domain-containing protein [Kineobactrum salinum]QIB64856.1 helix-turn-helix domain-containing protein [Kineobactrum salinum]
MPAATVTNRQVAIEIGILAMPQSTASPIYGMQELLGCPGRDWEMLTRGSPGQSLINTSIVSLDGKPMELVNGAWVKPVRALDDNYRPDVLCILEIVFNPQTGLVRDSCRREVRWLVDYWHSGGTVATACTGAVLLGEAGLLAGQDATTHWGYCDYMTRHYPGVRMHPDRILLASGPEQRLIMAGGGSSWMDLALYLISRFCGTAQAVRTARVHLIDWRQSGQTAYASTIDQRQSSDAVIARCQHWLAQHYDEPSPVAGVVAYSGLNERTFKRRFRLATGLTPIDYVLNLRLEEARHLLETSAAPVEAVAEMVGYQDAGFFRRKFRQRLGLTPAEYRRKFAGLRTVPTGGVSQPPGAFRPAAGASSNYGDSD